MPLPQSVHLVVLVNYIIIRNSDESRVIQYSLFINIHRTK